MKYTSIIFILVCSVSISASSLIFSAQKTVETDGEAVLGSFDAGKYKSVRVAVTTEGWTESPLTNSAAATRLKVAEFQMMIADKRVSNGEAPPLEHMRARAEFEAAGEMARQATDALFPPISVFAIEGKEEILLEGYTFRLKGSRMFSPTLAGSRSFVIEDPPATLMIKVSGKGRYKLYVWGR